MGIIQQRPLNHVHDTFLWHLFLLPAPQMVVETCRFAELACYFVEDEL